MHLLPPPGRGPGPGPGLGPTRPPHRLPLRLAAVISRQFDGTRPLDDDGISRYLSDVTGAYGAPDAARGATELAGRPVSSFAAMAVEVLADAGAEAAPDAVPPDGPAAPDPAAAGPVRRRRGSGIGQIVLAHATPDIDPRASAACYLVDSDPGRPLAFCLSDQGVGAPFLAVRVAGEYLRDADRGRALVVVLDQSAVPWPVPDGTRLPIRDLAVGLVLDYDDSADAADRAGGADGQAGSGTERAASGTGADPAGHGGGLALQQWPDVGPDQMAGALTGYLDSVRGRFGGPVTLVLGQGVPEAPAERVERGDPDGLCTSVWTTLHRLVTDHDGSDGAAVTFVLAEYDPSLRQLSAAAIRWEGA
ncbi:hypothetical protein [Actinacidiphila yeochonensis]|uniref:hypothetical protein n=1 Tax=Actinacidiphila yeochonensis TaxID=89050 RepID=UPI00068AA3E6|nr:hypothetical protein [Actinacidiphila yeochonensis]